MAPNRTVAASGALGLIFALALVALASFSGVPPVNLGSSLSTHSQPLNGSSTATTNASEVAGPGSGVLSVLLTDPPRAPSGVTQVYVYYSGLAVHSDGGWTVIREAGSVELFGTVNLAQTLASENLSLGTYDAARFNLVKAVITFNGANYTATVQGPALTVRFDGDAIVSKSVDAAAIIDVQATVVNVGSLTSPQFVLWTIAKAFPIPAAFVGRGIEAAGARLPLAGEKWWSDNLDQANATLKITGVDLSTRSLRVNVTDTGGSGVLVKLVVITSVSANPFMGGAEGTIPPEMMSSAVFLVTQNGSLVKFAPYVEVPDTGKAVNVSAAFGLLTGAGFNLTAGSSASFSYSGPIVLGLAQDIGGAGPMAGQSYWVTVVGQGAAAATEVVVG
jgi:hypothetical protein